MTKPVEEVPLGVLAKNESKNEDMVDILETIQQHNVPFMQHDSESKTAADLLFFGGDQLTEERARNIQRARADGETQEERLDTVWPKNEDWHSIRTAYKAVVSILRKEGSQSDWGTYTSNSVITGNFNASKDVESEHYDQIREFMSIETDAFIVSATLHHFGANSPDDTLVQNKPPEGLQKASCLEKRMWLHNQIDLMFDKYVSDSFSSLSKTKESIEAQTAKVKTRLPCRSTGCARSFVYPKCRLNHEKEVHGIIIEEDSTQFPVTEEKSQEVKEDFIFNYGCLHIALGLMLRNAEDSVKEGDGNRLLRAWKFLTYIFRLKGHTKYALAGLRLIASVEGLLTPRQAHRLTWNRFAGRKEGQGKRIARDLRVEQLNKISKEEIRALGFPNINEDSVMNATRPTAAIEEMQGSIQTFQCILKQVHNKAEVFNFERGRKFLVCPNLSREIYADLSPKSLQRWIKKHRNRWHRQNFHRYKTY